MFIYCPLILYNSKDRRVFLNVVEKFSLQSIEDFKKLVVYDASSSSQAALSTHSSFGYSIPTMKSWKNGYRICHKPTLCMQCITIRTILKRYKGSSGIYWLNRCCLNHYEGDAHKDYDQKATKDMLILFPRALPAIFNRLIVAFKSQPPPAFGFV